MRVRALRPILITAAIAAAALWAVAVTSTTRPLPVATPLVVNQAFTESADTVRRNETLSHLFARHNIYGAELLDLVQAAEGLNPRRVQPGQVFEFRYPVDVPSPDRIHVRLGDDQILSMARDSSGGWLGSSEPIRWTVVEDRVEGVITSSLWEAMDGAIPDSVLTVGQRSQLISALADDVFGWVIDFYRDFYPGDRFSVVYEILTSHLGDRRYGRVLAARIESRGAVRTAFVMTDERGRNIYFDSDGSSLRRAFKIKPIPFSRLTSRYSLSRFHPILKKARPHLGVDYAAATGTPIHVTADGTVTRAGRWGTYGVMVAVRHPNGIETRYGHLSRVAAGIVPGVRVEQDRVIGYVGMTGLATAPHVHYEMLKNGRQLDPRRMAQDSGDPVPPARREEFEAVKARFGRLLDGRPPATIAATPDP